MQFELQADFWLKSQGGDPADAAAAAAAAAALGATATTETKARKVSAAPAVAVPGARGGPIAGCAFMLHPPQLHLKVDEMQEVAVVALPEAEGVFQDVLMCRWENFAGWARQACRRG